MKYTPEQLLGFHAFAEEKGCYELATRIFIEALCSKEFSMSVHTWHGDQFGYDDENGDGFIEGEDFFECLEEGKLHYHQGALLVLSYDGKQMDFRLSELSKDVLYSINGQIHDENLIFFQDYADINSAAPIEVTKEDYKYFLGKNISPFINLSYADLDSLQVHAAQWGPKEPDFSKSVITPTHVEMNYLGLKDDKWSGQNFYVRGTEWSEYGFAYWNFIEDKVTFNLKGFSEAANLGLAETNAEEAKAIVEPLVRSYFKDNTEDWDRVTKYQYKLHEDAIV